MNIEIWIKSRVEVYPDGCYHKCRLVKFEEKYLWQWVGLSTTSTRIEQGLFLDLNLDDRQYFLISTLGNTTVQPACIEFRYEDLHVVFSDRFE